MTESPPQSDAFGAPQAACAPPAAAPCAGASLEVTPLVSVAMITYQHERFIGEAIESVLSQRTQFPIELVIGEDCSSDRTRQIVLDCQARDPRRIRVLTRTKNIGLQRNFLETFRACRGKYVALLEGDDVWIDPNKLQLQIDYLESHPECAGAAHNAMRFDEATHRDIAPCCFDTPETLTVADFLPMNRVPTCSVVFRREAIGALPEWMEGMPACDWILHILITRRGVMHYDDRIMGRYRVHSNGAWSGKSRASQLAADLIIYENLLQEMGEQYSAAIRRQMSRRMLDLMYQHEKDGHLPAARQNLARYLKFNLLHARLLRPAVGIAAGRLFMPRAYKLVLKSKNILLQLSRRATGKPMPVAPAPQHRA